MYEPASKQPIRDIYGYGSLVKTTKPWSLPRIVDHRGPDGKTFAHRILIYQFCIAQSLKIGANGGLLRVSHQKPNQLHPVSRSISMLLRNVCLHSWARGTHRVCYQGPSVLPVLHVSEVAEPHIPLLNGETLVLTGTCACSITTLGTRIGTSRTLQRYVRSELSRVCKI